MQNICCQIEQNKIDQSIWEKLLLENIQFGKKMSLLPSSCSRKNCLLIQICLHTTNQVLTGLMLEMLVSLTKVLLAQLYKCNVFEVFDCGT